MMEIAHKQRCSDSCISEKLYHGNIFEKVAIMVTVKELVWYKHVVNNEIMEQLWILSNWELTYVAMPTNANEWANKKSWRNLEMLKRTEKQIFKD